MNRRKPPEQQTPEQHKRWLEVHKNRNLHHVKFPDDLEADYQAWKAWRNLTSDNAALRHLAETHPDLKQKPND